MRREILKESYVGREQTGIRIKMPFPALKTLLVPIQNIDTGKDSQWSMIIRANDPSAGSPTETLLRLLLPLSDKVY